MKVCKISLILLAYFCLAISNISFHHSNHRFFCPNCSETLTKTENNTVYCNCKNKKFTNEKICKPTWLLSYSDGSKTKTKSYRLSRFFVIRLIKERLTYQSFVLGPIRLILPKMSEQLNLGGRSLLQL